MPHMLEATTTSANSCPRGSLANADNKDRHVFDSSIVSSKSESIYNMFFQVAVPFSIAGLGMVCAGIAFDIVKSWKLFVEVRETFILVPALCGLKGNLEMTLASRLSTLTNCGHMDNSKKRNWTLLSNVALNQILATVIALFASTFAIILHWITNGQLDWSHVCILSAASVATACCTSMTLDILMILIVIFSRKCGINPDNVATPVAASLGDLTTIMALSMFGTLFLNHTTAKPWIDIVFVVVVILISPLWIRQALRDDRTKKMLFKGWIPVISAMLLSSSGGQILEKGALNYAELPKFQPVINGVGGNLVAVQASRLSTYFHQNAIPGEIPDGHKLKHFCSIKRAFFSTDNDAQSARVLLSLVMPGHIIFNCFLYIFRSDSAAPPQGILFTAMYLTAALTQVLVLLYVCQYMIAAMWRWRIDPDNAAIPYLTALGDLLGSLLLFLVFLLLDKLHLDKLQISLI